MNRPNEITAITVFEARDRVTHLETERAIALQTEIADVAYIEDLEDELHFWRHRYTMAAVTEIAALHADLYGANFG